MARVSFRAPPLPAHPDDSRQHYRRQPCHNAASGGLIVNGDLYTGHNLTAGEIGHMVIEVNGPKCGCGNRGCLEALASRTAIFRKIEAAVKDGRETLLTDMLGKDLKGMRSGDLRKAFRRGDKFVAKVIEEAAKFSGIGVANLIDI